MESGVLANYHVPPDVLKGFPDAEVVAPKTPLAGGKLRKRWRDPAGKIYEWDYLHGRGSVTAHVAFTKASLIRHPGKC